MNPITPLQRYQQDLDSGEFTFDQSQRDAVEHTQALFESLYREEKNDEIFLKKVLKKRTLAFSDLRR